MNQWKQEIIIHTKNPTHWIAGYDIVGITEAVHIASELNKFINIRTADKPLQCGSLQTIADYLLKQFKSLKQYYFECGIILVS